MAESTGPVLGSAVVGSGSGGHRPRWPFLSALACGVVGLVANVFLVGFFSLGYPEVGDPSWGWLGFANDVTGIVEFALFLPVILAVSRLLPVSRSTTAITALALLAAAGLVVVSIALVVDAMSFDVQVRYVIAFLVVLYGWVLAVSSVGHRANALPRAATRLGLLLGISWPAALVLTLAGLLIGGVDLGALRFGLPGVLLVVPALVLGSISWLVLPVWPLLLAVTVFRARPTRPGAPSLMSEKENLR